MADEDVHRIQLRASTIAELRALLDGAEIDFGCRPVVRLEGGEFVVEVYSTLAKIGRLRGARSDSRVRVTVVENATEVGRARQAELGPGNRFAAARTPRGLGIKE